MWPEAGPFPRATLVAKAALQYIRTQATQDALSQAWGWAVETDWQQEGIICRKHRAVMSLPSSGTWWLQPPGEHPELGESIPAPCPAPCWVTLGCPSDILEPQPLTVHEDPRAPFSPPCSRVFSEDSSAILQAFRLRWTTLGLIRVTMAFYVVFPPFRSRK